MGIVEAIATANAGLGLLETLRQMARRDPLRRHQFRAIINSLRDIYFTPTGTQQVLRVLAEGGKPTADALTKALTEFNDAEWTVQQHVISMEFEALRQHSTLSIEHRLILSEIADHKISVRRDIQECLNVSSQEQSEIPPDRARELLGRITELNQSIQEIEHELLQETGSA